MRFQLPLSASAALVLPYVVHAFWRLNCGVIQAGRIDPIVNPGALAAHAHLITGGSNIGINTTYHDLLNSPCTSCEVRGDLSAYWTPLLYYWYPNGSFFEVPHGGNVVYYLGRGPNAPHTVPYPPGFQMLSGDKSARSYDNRTYTWGNATYPGRPVADRVSFACLYADGPSPAEQPRMFTPTKCANGMRAQIAFQGCWDGVHLYKADNSHVDYMSGIDSGVCPPSHPVQLPLLFVEVNYAVSQVPGATDDSRFVFSQGDPTGYGFHGDFMNAWEPELLANATRDCLWNGATNGVIQECEWLSRQDTNGAAFNCPEEPPQVGEPVRGLIDHLPGCVRVTYGPEAATPADMNCPAGAVKPSVTPTPMGVPRPTSSPTPGDMFGLPNYQYKGCYNDSGPGGGYRALNALSITNYGVMTVEWCQNYCAENGYRWAGVEYAQECHCDNFINPTAVVFAAGAINMCTWNCGGTMTLGGTQNLCGGLSWIDIYENIDVNFDAFGNNDDTAGNAQPYQPQAGFGEGYMGCYTDRNGRPLTGSSFKANNMSVEVCRDFCALQNHGNGYQYYGMEYYSECYCGNSIANGNQLLTASSLPSNSSCNFRCKGAGAEVCGGFGVTSVYKSSTARVPETVAHVGRYKTQQCLLDPGHGGRGLQGNATSHSDMTVDKCVKFCLGSFYHYAGVEFAQECYCGNSIVTNTGAAVQDCDPTQQMLCLGDSLQYCGGPGFMNLYYSETL